MSRELFQAILNHPEDASLRLLYADWLEERGDIQADLIRLQLPLHPYTYSDQPWYRRDNSPFYQERRFLDQFRRILNAAVHQKLLGTPLANKVGRRQPIRGWKYRRGMVEEIRAEAWVFVQHAELLFQLGPLRRLHLLDAQAFLPAIAASPYFARLETLTLLFRALPEAQALRRFSRAMRPSTAPHVYLCGRVPEDIASYFRSGCFVVDKGRTPS